MNTIAAVADLAADREAIVRERYADLRVACELFVKGLPHESDINVGFDVALLIDVTRSAYDDIWRYKDYHLGDPKIQRSDAVKRAAYTTKWLIRLRPIYVVRSTAKISKDDGAILLNESFAIIWSFNNIAADLKVSSLMPAKRKLCELIYDFHFRQITEDALIAIYQFYLDAARGEKFLRD